MNWTTFLMILLMKRLHWGPLISFLGFLPLEEGVHKQQHLAEHLHLVPADIPRSVCPGSLLPWYRTWHIVYPTARQPQQIFLSLREAVSVFQCVHPVLPHCLPDGRLLRPFSNCLGSLEATWWRTLIWASWKPDLGAKIKSSLLQTNDQGVLILHKWQETSETKINVNEWMWPICSSRLCKEATRKWWRSPHLLCSCLVEIQLYFSLLFYVTLSYTLL